MFLRRPVIRLDYAIRVFSLREVVERKRVIYFGGAGESLGLFPPPRPNRSSGTGSNGGVELIRLSDLSSPDLWGRGMVLAPESGGWLSTLGG